MTTLDPRHDVWLERGAAVGRLLLIAKGFLTALFVDLKAPDGPSTDVAAGRKSVADAMVTGVTGLEI